jgi:hypothetical protein
VLHRTPLFTDLLEAALTSNSVDGQIIISRGGKNSSVKSIQDRCRKLFCQPSSSKRWIGNDVAKLTSAVFFIKRIPALP